MTIEPFDYRDGDTPLRGYLAREDVQANRRPAVLVVHEAFGLDGHVKERSQRLAEIGYVALAADMYDQMPRDRAHAMELMKSLRSDPAKVRQRARAALDALASHPSVDSSRMAAIGYCFGGYVALELARDGVRLRGVVSFHGSLKTDRPAEPGTIKAKVLVCHGANDPFIPPADVVAFEDEMRRAGTDWQVISYGNAVHGFTNRQADARGIKGVGYSESADRRSWAAMRSFFEEIFAG
jgi:dienelactone hydrolase